MTIERRLSKLEPGAREAHERAWARFWRLHDRHALPVEALIRAVLASFTEACELSDDGFGALWELHGYREAWVPVFDAWGDDFLRLSPPLNTTPALSLWPHAFPSPPPEPPGLYALLVGHARDSEPNRQACALMSLVILASARACRDFKGGDYRDHE